MKILVKDNIITNYRDIPVFYRTAIIFNLQQAFVFSFPAISLLFPPTLQAKRRASPACTTQAAAALVLLRILPHRSA